MNTEPTQGQSATLITPYMGYTRITLIQQTDYKWEVEICGSGKTLFIYEDEFVLDN